MKIFYKSKKIIFLAHVFCKAQGSKIDFFTHKNQEQIIENKGEDISQNQRKTNKNPLGGS